MYIISQKTEVFVHGIFEHLLDIGIQTSFRLEVSEPQVIPVDFLVGFEEFLAMNVITGDGIDQEGFGVEPSIQEDQVGGNVFFL